MAERTGLSTEDVAGALARPRAPIEASSLKRLKPRVRRLAEHHLGSNRRW